jgi:hypothetical protein
MKSVNHMNRKDMTSVTKVTVNSHFDRSLDPLDSALQEGLDRGALGEAITGAPTGGGV